MLFRIALNSCSLRVEYPGGVPLWQLLCEDRMNRANTPRTRWRWKEDEVALFRYGRKRAKRIIGYPSLSWYPNSIRPPLLAAIGLSCYCTPWPFDPAYILIYLACYHFISFVDNKFPFLVRLFKYCVFTVIILVVKWFLFSFLLKPYSVIFLAFSSWEDAFLFPLHFFFLFLISQFRVPWG